MADQVLDRTIGGRQIQFHPPTDAQILMVGRLMRTNRPLLNAKEEELDRDQVMNTVERMSTILDIIDSMVVNPADRDWLEARIVDGTLDLSELTGVLGDGEDEKPTNRATKRATARKSTSRARRS